MASPNQSISQADKIAFMDIMAKAIKHAENNPRNHGVLSVKTDNPSAVLNNSVKNNFKRWESGKTPAPWIKESPEKFVDFMKLRWAPDGAENDPNNLNKNWAPNVKSSIKKQVGPDQYKKFEALDLVKALNPFQVSEAHADEVPSEEPPPLPEGFTMVEDEQPPPLPEGFVMDEPSKVDFSSGLEGGSMSPANIQAQQAVKEAQGATDALDPAVAAVKAGYNMSWPVSMLAKSAIGEGDTSVPEPTTGGGKLLGDLGAIANPLLGATLGLGGKAIGGIGKVFKYAKPQNQIKLADEVQNGLLSAKRSVIDKYGPEYEKIIGQSTSKVNIEPAIKNFVDEAQGLMQNPEFAQQIAAKNPQAMRIFDMVEKFKRTSTGNPIAGDISAKEADNLSKFIKNIPSIRNKLAQGNKNGWHTVQWTNEDRMLIGLADDIKGEVVQSHPALMQLNKDYGQFMGAYKRVAPDFKIGTTISKMKDYGSYDPQKAQLLEGILPKSTVNRIKDFSRANATSKILKQIGLYGAGAAGLGAAGKVGMDTMEAFGK